MAFIRSNEHYVNFKWTTLYLDRKQHLYTEGETSWCGNMCHHPAANMGEHIGKIFMTRSVRFVGIFKSIPRYYVYAFCISHDLCFWNDMQAGNKPQSIKYSAESLSASVTVMKLFYKMSVVIHISNLISGKEIYGHIVQAVSVQQYRKANKFISEYSETVCLMIMCDLCSLFCWWQTDGICRSSLWHYSWIVTWHPFRNYRKDRSIIW